jgi:uncharacterized protein (TIGR00369 family)
MSDPEDGREELHPVPASRIPAFNKMLGMDRVRAGRGRAEVELDVRGELTNQRGVVHGGVIASLLDSALGAAIISAIRPEEWCGTIQLNVQFLLPGRGARLVGQGRMVRRGERVAFAAGEVIDDAGRRIASAEGTWYIWPTRPRP